MACLYQTNKPDISRPLKRIGPLVSRGLGVKRTIYVSHEVAMALIVDCTEQPIERPSRKQRCWSSGKKNRHTMKTEVVITEKGQIANISKPAPGRVHDLEIRRRGPPLPENSHVYADSGYQGLQKIILPLICPIKRPTRNP